jgi:anti-anti-sigma factor
MHAFSVDLEILDRVVVVNLAGELTTRTREILHPILEQVLGSSVDLVVLDFSALTLLDAGGSAALSVARVLARNAGVELLIANADGQPADLLRKAAIDDAIPLHFAHRPVRPWRTADLPPALIVLELFADDEMADDATVIGSLRDGLAAPLEH